VVKVVKMVKRKEYGGETVEIEAYSPSSKALSCRPCCINRRKLSTSTSLAG